MLPPPSHGCETPVAQRRIAVVGKGGSGKTLVSALLVGQVVRRRDRRILAIDADSAVSLPYALGLEPTRTVAGIRREMIHDPMARARAEDRHISDVMAGALVHGDGFHLLAMGRPEGPGCYCAVNDLLRYGIEGLAARYDLTVIDCEAGPEQVNRRVTGGVDRLLLVTEPTVRGLRVAESIAQVVRQDEALRPGEAVLVVNRAERVPEGLAERAAGWGVEVVGCIPEDDTLRRCDGAGEPLIGLPDDTPAVAAVAGMVERLIV